ncbi:MAG: S-layer homology domain-containing protein [Alkalinema sp. CAN_BIN05]|nr:S-layer homology domain-containing protein [Alkalinema sp. CAN_BIN05]
MTVRSVFVVSLVLLLGGCAGNQDAENALKPDARLNSSPGAVPSPVPSSNIPPTAKPTPIESPTESPTKTPIGWQDIDKTPAQLRPYVDDMLALNLVSPDAQMPDGSNLNAPISRREFAKWLLLTNNRFYQSRPTKQIRIDRPSNRAAFQDISSSDPDFAILQSLADAGILPSTLSGDRKNDGKNDRFKPTEALTREELLRWKMPLDSRPSQADVLAIESLQKTLPFQDLSKVIHPETIRLVALDLQNGDRSNLRRSLGYTTLLQPQRSVTRAEAASVLWSIGAEGGVLTAKDVLKGSLTIPATPIQVTPIPATPATPTTP